VIDKPGYIFMEEDKYVGIDDVSGGNHPFKASNIFDAKIWYEVERAREYHNRFKDRGWILFEIKDIVLREILTDNRKGYEESNRGGANQER